MKVLITGSAGFIGSALCIKLLDLGDIVVGIDNHNDYYDPELKERRLARHIEHPNYTHIRMDIEDEKAVESLFNATVVDRLLAEAAIIIGRLNCDEFAMGSANENTIHGTVKNPIENSKVAGGSSGGSAAAVAAGLCLAALGSDTGGSIRQPASFCGIVGLKPTYSRVSRYGLIAYASSFDQIGPLTNTIRDAALVLEVIAGEDKYDNTSSTKKIEN